MAKGVIQTYTGKKVNVPYMTKEDFDIIDVAHSLSLTCRYSGHCLKFYSVAEHSIIVAHLLEQYSLKDALWGLLHDAGEAYFGDVVSPIKVLLPDFKLMEDNFLFSISNWFYLDWPMSRLIRDMDKQVLRMEQQSLMKKTDWIWDETKNIKNLPYTLKAYERQIFGSAFHIDGFKQELLIEEFFITQFNYLLKEIENEKQKSKSR